MLSSPWGTPLLVWLSMPLTALSLVTPGNGDLLSAHQLNSPTWLKIPVQEVENHWIAKIFIGGQEVLLCVDTGSSPL